MDCTEPHETGAISLRDALSADSNLSPAGAAVRNVLLEGLTSVRAFAEGVDKCERTVNQWIAQGMPTVYVGRTPYIPIAEARAWLLKPRSRCAAARKPGRPATRKAA
jgi:hypothetical protein